MLKERDERGHYIVPTGTVEEQGADKLEAMADWFTDCKTLPLERLPKGLIEACRAGAKALRAALAEGLIASPARPKTVYDKNGEPLR